MPPSIIIADYDSGTLTGFYIMFLTVALVLICLPVAGLLFSVRYRTAAKIFLIVAGLCLLIGLCATFVVIRLSQKGVIHSL